MGEYGQQVRYEEDASGAVAIEADRYWGAQTQRALALFAIGSEQLPVRIIHTFGWHKAAACSVNKQLGLVSDELADVIVKASMEVATGHFDAHFPLPVWQTGSGTQTNMNVNEVIANRANELLGHELGTRSPVHPNDHVNRSQSSNDSFPTVMNTTALMALNDELLPALEELKKTFGIKAQEFSQELRIGRTHLNDAVPMWAGQSFDVYYRQIEHSIERFKSTQQHLQEVPQGGTAIGTGVNAPEHFDSLFCEQLTQMVGIQIRPAKVKGEVMAAHDALVELSGNLNVLATALVKIANDIRLLSSGPRSGFGEYIIPDDGLSSSIMPGKRNACVAEMLLQVCHRVMGNHTTVTHAATSGLFELNVAKPVLIHSVLQSVELLAQGCDIFCKRLITELSLNSERLEHNVSMSLMLATGLSPSIGYDKVAQITLLAQQEKLSVKEAALILEYVTEEEFDSYASPASMLGPFANITKHS